ncbi:MAG: hypothetical protein EAX96_03780 [Candidatus Lokiarchaeota archaeon]|nr:hypothetical protein [Candidatus Lokiarchaeota archaeon]
MKDNIKKFGLPSLDDLLGGGVSAGSSILLVSDGVGTRKREFSHHFIAECLKKEKGHIIEIDYSIPPHNLLRSMFDTEMLKDLDVSKFNVINCYGSIRGQEEYNGFKIESLQNPNDISKLRFIIDNLRRNIGNNSNVRWIFDDITSAVITIGAEDKVLRFLREIFHALKDYGDDGDLGLFFVDRNSHSQQFVSSLENLCETVIHLSVKPVSNLLLPHLRVMKNRFFGETVLNAEVPYSFYHGEVKMRTELMSNFNLMKRNLINQSDGTLELFETKYLLTPATEFTELFKNLYESLDYNEYRRTTYNVGRNSTSNFYEKYLNYFNVDRNDIPLLIAKHYSSLGYGNLILKKMDIENGLIVVHCKDLFKWDDAIRPIHAVICGGISLIAEKFSGESYEVIETRCTATGDDFCEFIGSPSRELAPLSQDLIKIKDELIIDKSGSLTLFGSRVLLIPQGTLMHIIDATEDLTDKEKSKEILYHAGERMALQFCQILTAKYKLRGMSIIRAYSQIVATRGWGITDIKEIDLDKGYMRAIVKNPLIGTRDSLDKEAKDYISAGVFAGMLEFVTKKKLICEEVKCLAKGDEFCEFIVRPFESYSDLVL